MPTLIVTIDPSKRHWEIHHGRRTNQSNRKLLTSTSTVTHAQLWSRRSLRTFLVSPSRAIVLVLLLIFSIVVRFETWTALSEGNWSSFLSFFQLLKLFMVGSSLCIYSYILPTLRLYTCRYMYANILWWWSELSCMDSGNTWIELQIESGKAFLTCSYERRHSTLLGVCKNCWFGMLPVRICMLHLT